MNLLLCRKCISNVFSLILRYSHSCLSKNLQQLILLVQLQYSTSQPLPLLISKHFLVRILIIEVLTHACVYDALNLISKSNTNCSQD